MSTCTVCVKAEASGVVDDGSLTHVALGELLGVSETAVRRHRKHDTKPTATTTDEPTPGGESESHSLDGSASYVRYSDEPWGYEDYRDFIRTTGQDPDLVTFSWGWTSNPGGGFWNKLNHVRPIVAAAASSTTLELPALYHAARTKPRARVKTEPVQRATVVVMADPQIGKTGRRGGTPELIDRMQEKREKVTATLRARRPSRILYADAGDGFENFESGGNPMFTNDLSLPQQMDCYGTETYLMLEVLHRFAGVDAMAVPSNHTQWRRGKQQLGRPSDDLGLFVHTQVAKVTAAAQMDVTWHFPTEYDESVAVRVLDTVVGLVHGNQFGPGQAVSWWEKQAFGAQAVAAADVLVTGHYHSFGAGVAGRNPASGRERFWLGAPTLDNGSDFYRMTAGRDSDPGLLVFDVTPDGFDLGSLIIL